MTLQDTRFKLLSDLLVQNGVNLPRTRCTRSQMDTDIDTGKEEMKKELDRATQVDSDTDKEGRKERIRMCHTSGQ